MNPILNPSTDQQSRAFSLREAASNLKKRYSPAGELPISVSRSRKFPGFVA